MLRRRLLFRTGLMALLAALFAAPLAGAASADTVGPAYFVKATGGMFKVPVHANGLTVYSSSPAYLVLQADSSDATAAIESDAAKHNFPWVAVADTMLGQAGMACFSNAHLVTTTSRVDAFTDNDVFYNGMFLQYLSWHFQAGAKKAADCGPPGGGLTAAPSVAVGRTSVNLHIDCLVKRCAGTFVSYSQSRRCKHPARLAAGHRGCPLISGHFAMAGGLSVNFRLPLKGRAPGSIFAAITVNGRRRPATPLDSLPRSYGLPAKQHPAALSLTCPSSGTVGTPVMVSGRLAPSGSPAPVTLTFANDNSSPAPVSALTDASGAFTAPFTPSTGGGWVLDAVFAGDRTLAHAQRTCRFSVTP